MSPEKLKEFLKEKKVFKAQLAKSLDIDTKKPLIAIILDEELDNKDTQNLEKIMEACNNINLQVVLLTDSSNLQSKNSDIVQIDYNQHNRHKLIAAADMAISFKFNDVEEMLVHGTIPIAGKRKGIEDYNPNSEKGNAFIYTNHNPWSIFAALIRATETFKFPYDWKNIMKQGIESMRLSNEK